MFKEIYKKVSSKYKKEVYSEYDDDDDLQGLSLDDDDFDDDFNDDFNGLSTEDLYKDLYEDVNLLNFHRIIDSKELSDKEKYKSLLELHHKVNLLQIIFKGPIYSFESEEPDDIGDNEYKIYLNNIKNEFQWVAPIVKSEDFDKPFMKEIQKLNYRFPNFIELIEKKKSEIKNKEKINHISLKLKR